MFWFQEKNSKKNIKENQKGPRPKNPNIVATFNPSNNPAAPPQSDRN